MLWFRPTYFGPARSTIETLVGNELAMQDRVNLSIQLPRDDSSLLPIHADAFGGETPFQVVEWLPLAIATRRNRCSSCRAQNRKPSIRPSRATKARAWTRCISWRPVPGDGCRHCAQQDDRDALSCGL
jgi:sporadic carbohydrate cluster 2OG-Fe(II) oxygenase